jgi:hypothetical protein
VQIYGERVAGGSASGTTGNDTIRLLGTSLTSRGRTAVTIHGESNAGGEVTGGNDEITIADSVIAARGGFNHSVTVEVVGDINTAVGGQTATVGGGNDRISIRQSTIEAVGTAAGSRNRVIVRLLGDVNTVNATIPGTTTGADTFGTIGGGNDDIAVTDTHIAARAPGTGTSDISVLIVGDRNLVSGSADTVVVAAATVGGGNDSIAVAGSTVAATGAPSNTVRVDVLGEDIEAFALPFTTTTTSTVGGGNDRIAVTDTPVVTDGVFGDTALLFVRGEAATGSYATIVIGGGNDTVTVHNVRFAVGAIDDLTGFFIDTGSGNDRVQVTDSAAQFYSISLGDGDDRLTFTNNFIGANFFGAPASLDGGPGFDRLTAHGNTGPGGLTWFNFEAEDVTT